MKNQNGFEVPYANSDALLISSGYVTISDCTFENNKYVESGLLSLEFRVKINKINNQKIKRLI